MAHEPTPHYRLVERDGPCEVRAYEPMVIAETRVAGARRHALNEGFKILFGFISGQNDRQEKLAMTVPVTAQMEGGENWAVRFIMPPRAVLDSLPKPSDPRIALFEVPVARAAVKRFSGLASDARTARETVKLQNWIAAHTLKPLGLPVHAYYNSPMTLPFLRRNEVMIALDY